MKDMDMFSILCNIFAINRIRHRDGRRDELEGVDIEKEMELVRQKKSQLSVRLRNEVKARYESQKKILIEEE